MYLTIIFTLQEAESEHASVMNELYRFYNPRASSVRSLMVANCVEPNTPTEGESSRKTVNKKENAECERPNSSSSESRDTRTGNPLSNLPLERELLDRGTGASTSQGALQGGFQSWRPFENDSHINYSNEYCSERGSSIASQQGSNEVSASSPVSDMDSNENSLDDAVEPTEPVCVGESGHTSKASTRSRAQKRQRDQRG